MKQRRSNLENIKECLTNISKDSRFQVDWFVESQVSEDLAGLLVEYGILCKGDKARLIIGRRSDCHNNAVKLVERYVNWTRHFGFALSNDNIWRVHGWCTNTRGRIIETTAKRTLYYGIGLK